MTVGLVGCSARKLDRVALAGDLYQGALFKAARRYLLATTDRWAILSAKHGLVMPHQPVKPYDETLVRMPWERRAAWAERVREQLRASFPGAVFVVIAGKEYLGAVEGLPHTVEFGGLTIGRKLAALNAANARLKLERSGA